MHPETAVALELSSNSTTTNDIRSVHGAWKLTVGGAILVLGAWLLLTSLWLSIQLSSTTLHGLLVEGRTIAPTRDPARALAHRAQLLLTQKILLTADNQQIWLTRQELGQRFQLNKIASSLMAIGRSGYPVDDLWQWYQAREGKIDIPWPTRVDEAVLRGRLAAIKRKIDRSPAAGVVDIPRQHVDPGTEGARLDVDAAVAAVRRALVSGKRVVGLEVSRVPISESIARSLSIEAVLGTYQTRFSGRGEKRNRARNVFVATRRFGSFVLGPGATFSFNDRVGPRTVRRGFRKAKGIRGGEMVDDDVGGGTCQVASTVHAAALLAGLEVVEHHPHSRPSGYIRMGLDATVAYPTRDLKVRNPYSFPVALHVKAHRGRLLARVLGPSRPFKTTIVRRILSRIRFAERQVLDASLPLGSRVVSQHGIRGYRVERVCKISGGDREGTYVKTLLYPPTTRVVRVGTGPLTHQVVASVTRKRYGETSRWPSRVVTIVQ